MPSRPGASISQTPDGYVKVGNGPYVKWIVTTVGGEKFYALWIKENVGDTPKEIVNG
jgi:hypothetical protein